MNKRVAFLLAAPLALTACSDTVYDPRGVDHKETLLSVSATGEAETTPDEARFQAGVQKTAGSAKAASAAVAEDIGKIVEALAAQGIAEKDIQTRNVGVQRIDYGPQRGQFQANNIVSVTVRDVDKVSAVVAAVTDVGANVVSGPKNNRKAHRVSIEAVLRTGRPSLLEGCVTHAAIRASPHHQRVVIVSLGENGEILD